MIKLKKKSEDDTKSFLQSYLYNLSYFLDRVFKFLKGWATEDDYAFKHMLCSKQGLDRMMLVVSGFIETREDPQVTLQAELRNYQKRCDFYEKINPNRDRCLSWEKTLSLFLIKLIDAFPFKHFEKSSEAIQTIIKYQTFKFDLHDDVCGEYANQLMDELFTFIVIDSERRRELGQEQLLVRPPNNY